MLFLARFCMLLLLIFYPPLTTPLPMSLLARILVPFFILLSVCSAQNTVLRLQLFNAGNDAPIDGFESIDDGAIINFATIGTSNLDIVAQVADSEGATQSIRFELSGATIQSRTESGAPYVLGGDSNGDYNGITFNVGDHTLVVTPFSGDSAGGSAGVSLSRSFTVVNGIVPTTTVLDALTDFPVITAGAVPYYKHTAEGALAIDAANVAFRGPFARAEATFSGEAGVYEVTLRTLRELDGECVYRLLINGVLQGSVTNDPTSVDYAPQNHLFSDINIPAGATIAVESATDSNGLFEEDGGFAWARGRWTTLTLEATSLGLAPSADAGVDQFVALPATSVELTGSATASGAETTYTWSQVSGPNTATLSGIDSLTLNASNMIAGQYEFELLVTDENGQSTSDSVSVLVAEPGSAGIISGELKTWHAVTITFDGPSTSETAEPNPFRDLRLDVTFTHSDSGEFYRVPGYYAADGNAANSSADSGNKWRAHFSPPLTGEWTYLASFRTGQDIAAEATLGTSAGFFDGATDSFTVAATDKSGRDFRGKGWLQYTGEHYPRFKGTGEIFLKQGPDSPENLLAYEDFDDTPNDPDQNGNLRKSFSPHSSDYDEADASDYTWKDGNGSELLGALRYLSDDEGLNSISFLTFNIDGDDDNVFPHRLTGSVADYEAVSDNNRWNGGVVYKDRFDVSKLSQWGRIFSYADKKGLFLHFKTQEIENDDRMDGGDLGVERKLYYRELIARFGHHLALNWNLGEENGNTTAQRIAFSEYFHQLDAYGHPIVIHTWPDQQDQVYGPMLGDASKLSGASIQTNENDFRLVHGVAAKWVKESRDAGQPWMVAVDEPGDAGDALRPDSNKGNSHELGRKNALWGTFLAGGWGNEWYFGYSYSDSDMTLQNFRSRDAWWDYCRIALEFFEKNPMPLNDMVNDNSISSASDDYGFYKAGDVYLVYLKNGGTTDLDLSAGDGEFTVRWYDTRNGGDLQAGTVTSVTGGGSVNLGQAPLNTSEDWLIVVERIRRIAYIYGDIAPNGTIPSGSAEPYDQMLLSDSGSTGLSSFKALVEAQGYSIGQYYDQDTTLDSSFLGQFDVVIFGLHQKIWSETEKAALDTWIRAGGGILTYSDSAAGGYWETVGAQNTVGQTAVNNLIRTYGMEVTVDQADGVRAATVPVGATHPVVEGELTLEGEGVSPIAIDPSGSARSLIDYPFSVSKTQNLTFSDPVFSALAFSTVGEGHVMAMFDRQPLWNSGIGSSILEKDNEEILRRIVVFLAGDFETISQTEAVLSASPSSGLAPLQVDFNAQSSVPATGANIVAYEWDFENDGTVDSTLARVYHTYTTKGTFTAKLTITDSFGSTSTATTTIDVISQDPFGNGGLPWPIPGRIEAENFDEGGAGLAYSDTTSNNQSGAYRDHGVDVENASDASGTYNISYTADGEWLEYTVDVTQAGTYRAIYRVASESNGGSIRLFVDGVDKTGVLNFDPTAAWQNYTDVTTAEFSLEAGRQVIRIDIVDGDFNFNWFELERITTSFDDFIAGYPELSGAETLPEADSDGDGIANVIEQWLGLDPTVSNPGQAMTVSVIDSSMRIGFWFDPSVSGSTLKLQISENLIDWDDLTIQPEWITADGEMNYVEVDFLLDGEKSQLFQRLRVE